MNTTIEDQVARYSRAVTARDERDGRAGGRSLREYAQHDPAPGRGRSVWAVAALVVFGLLVAAGAAVLGGGATDTDLAGPAGNEDVIARGLLDDAVALVSEGRADEVCTTLAASVTFCDRIYGEVDPARIPSTPPQVVDARTIGGEEPDQAYVLTVCGLDGAGQAYVSDFVVMATGDTYAVQNPIYWSDLEVVEPVETGEGTAGGEVTATDTESEAGGPEGCP
jgi:hypothetical protein